MFFVISLTLLTIVNDALIGNNLISSWFGMVYSWYGGLICTTGAGCSDEVGPMPHGCVI